MIAALVVFAYLAVILYVGIFAFRRGTNKAEDFFVANRSLGTAVFLLSLFGTNMTAFTILGSSGLSFKIGVGVFGLMASISAIVIPLTIFFIGTRIWAIGKKFGHLTQVQIFRDRWEAGHIGTVIFALQAVMLVPYIIIGVMGGGETLSGVSGGFVPYWLGGLIVALVVMSYVFFGGMRGTAWVNAVQTTMFLLFGTLAFVVIARGMGGFGHTVREMARTLDAPASQQAAPVPAAAPALGGTVATTRPATTPADAAVTAAGAPAPGAAARPAPRPDGDLLTRHRISKGEYFSFALIPLSSIMFPHIAIFCLTARKMSSFRKTVIFYPICIMAIWLPAVYLGAVAPSQPPVVATLAVKSPGFAELKKTNPTGAQLIADLAQDRISIDDPAAEPLRAGPLRGEMRRLANSASDGVMLAMLEKFAPLWLAGVLGAAIMACVMASDSQILAISTMFSEDVFAFYGGKARYGDVAQVWAARIFVVACTVVAYFIAITVKTNIFGIATQYAFSGYTSMFPIMIACLFWKRSTKWAALATTLWIFACLLGLAAVQYNTAAPAAPGAVNLIWRLGDVPLLYRGATGISFTQYRFMPVLPMFVGACLVMWLVSLVTPPPSRRTLDRYFPPERNSDLPSPVGVVE